VSRKGALTVVGTGYGGGGQLTPQSESAIAGAGVVLYLVSDPVSAQVLRDLNPRTVSLHDCYREGRSGPDAGKEMIARILAAVRAGEDVCAAFYGHPSIFVQPARESVKRARAEGFSAQILPAISSLDCLYADLGVDPGARGWQLFEATDFILNQRMVDTLTPLALMQAGAVGITKYSERTDADPRRVQILVDRLLEMYPAEHEVTIYEIAQLPIYETRMERVALAKLASAKMTVYATLYVPPLGKHPLDEGRLRKLGLRVRDGQIENVR
jgi:uncharacterized protein YabN with tetrapyrrole methylase and pyrophosphatase domain